MKNGLIYKIIFPNGRIYIGQTTCSLKCRKQQHLYEANRPSGERYSYKLYRAIRKYSDQLRWEVLYDNIPEDQLNIAEICAIYTFDSYYNGYNSTLGGDGNRGYVPSQETRNKLSIINQGKRLSAETKKKISESGKGKHIISAEARKKLNIGKIGLHHSEEHKKNISRSLKGICRSYATKVKSSIAKGGRLFGVYKKDTGEIVGNWISQSLCAKELNLTPQLIGQCLLGRRKSHRGYIFKYE